MVPASGWRTDPKAARAEMENQPYTAPDRPEVSEQLGAGSRSPEMTSRGNGKIFRRNTSQ